MSLIKCPECQKEVSSSATSCPHCGYPLKSTVVDNKDNIEKLTVEPNYPQPISSEWSKKWKVRSIWMRVIGSVLTILFIVLFFTMLHFWHVIFGEASLFWLMFLILPFTISIAIAICTHCNIREIDGYTVVAYTVITRKLIIENVVCQSKLIGRYLYGKLPNGKNIKVVYSWWDNQPDIQVYDGDM